MSTILFAFQSFHAIEGYATSGTLEYLCSTFIEEGEHTMDNLKKAASHDTMEYFIGDEAAAKQFIRDRRGSKDINLLAKEVCQQNEIIQPSMRVTWTCPDTGDKFNGFTKEYGDDDGLHVAFDDGEEGYCHYNELDPLNP